MKRVLEDVSESSWPDVICSKCNGVVRPRNDWNDRFRGLCKTCLL